MIEKLSVRKPFTVLVGVIFIIVLGVISFMNTSTDLMPDMNLPYAVIMTTYPGMTPEQVEADITVPIEGRMGTVGGIDNITSMSNEHYSVVILEFVSSTNMDSASLEIRESLDRITLPDGAGKPTIMKINPTMLPVMVSAVYMQNKTIHEVSELTESNIAPALESVAGVASVSTSGLIKNQLNVILRQEKIDEVNLRLQEAVTAMMQQAAMAAAQAAQAGQELPGGFAQDMEGQANGQLPQGESVQPAGIPSQMLTVESVTGILKAQDFSVPAGVMTEDDVEYMVRVGEHYSSVEAVASTLLFDPGIEGFEPVRLSDIADVFASDNSESQYTRVNSSPAVMVTLQKQSEFSTSDVTHAVLTKMDGLAEKYEGLEFAVLMDQGEYIDIIINSVVYNLLIGSVLAILILILFLRDLRPTLIVGISIPVSLLLAFAAMYFTGVSLNIISMSGLALGVGMLVDNSIVVIENTYRLRNQGIPAKRAAVDGARQVAGAIAASTLTTVAVFLPIVFTEGITRQLFTDLALTIAYSLFASLLIALTVVPAASSGIFRSMREKEHKLFDRIIRFYTKLLRAALRIKWAVVAAAFAAFIILTWVMMQKGTEFMPSMDAEQITVNAALPEGAVFEEAVAVAEALSERVRGVDDVETVGVTVGGGSMFAGLMGGGSSSGGTDISMYVLLSEKRSLTNAEVSQLIRDKTQDLGCEISVSGDSSGNMSAFMGDGISVSVLGHDLDSLRDTAIEVANIVRSVEGAVNVTDIEKNAAPEWRVRVDKDEAMRHGLTVAQVYMAVSGALTDPQDTVSMTLSGGNCEVVVWDGDWSAPDFAGLESLSLTNTTGETVPLKDVAEIYEDTGFSAVNRENGSRYVTISGEIEHGYNVGLVNGEIERRLSDYTPAEGCSLSFGGQAEMIESSFSDLWLMLLLALVFIYLIMVAQFQSLLSPFIVMFTIPLAFTGGFIALLIAGMPLSVVGMIGLILLTGVVVNNGIVFVDCVNRLRREGLSKKDALTETGRIRLRPILMTALTTIVAMSTMMLGMGQGTEMMQPMAVSTVGGLLYATLMTLFVVPVMYDIFHKEKDLSRADDLDYDPSQPAE